MGPFRLRHVTALTVIGLLVAACSPGPDRDEPVGGGFGGANQHTTTTELTITETTGHSGDIDPDHNLVDDVEEHELHDPARGEDPALFDLRLVDRSVPYEVARYWGCAYFAHPLGETPEGHGARLAPLSTRNVIDEVADLSLAGLDNILIITETGAVERMSEPGWYDVFCNRYWLNPDGTPADQPSPARIHVHVTDTPNGWIVDNFQFAPAGYFDS